MLKIICPHCHGEKVDRNHVEVLASRRYRFQCLDCKKVFVVSGDENEENAQREREREREREKKSE
jgi:transposase-like protein